MKIAISANGENLDAQVDTRFGRCPYFIIVNPDSMGFEAIPNKSAMASGGAGGQAAQSVVGMGVEIVITGNLGPNAHRTLMASGIKLIPNASGLVRDVVERLKMGEWENIYNPTEPRHPEEGR